MKSIYKQNKREIKHIGSKRFGVQFLLKSIYTNNGLLYFHTELKNTSNIAFDIDFVSFKIVDKKVIKRTAMQEQALEPLRVQNYVTVVHGKSSERTAFALEKFTIPTISSSLSRLPKRKAVAISLSWWRTRIL